MFSVAPPCRDPKNEIIHFNSLILRYMTSKQKIKFNCAICHINFNILVLTYIISRANIVLDLYAVNSSSILHTLMSP